MSSLYLDFHPPSLNKSSLPLPQEEAVFSDMKLMMNMQQAKLNHLSSQLSQSNDNNELQKSQDTQPNTQLEVHFPRQQFPEKLYHMLELANAQGFGTYSNAVSWLPNGRAFTVCDEKVFMESIVPLFFKSTKMRSFARQLNLWGFKRSSDGSCTYCHERFVRGSPEELRFMVRIKIKSKSSVIQKKSADLPLEVNEGQQLQHREDGCTQVSPGSLSEVHVSSQSPIPVSIEAGVPHPTAQYLLAERSFKRRVSMQDDDEPDGVSGVGISSHDPIMLALTEGSIKSKSNNISQVCLGSLSDVRVSSQSLVSSEMEADVPPSVTSVGNPSSQYSAVESSPKRRVTLEYDDAPVVMLDQVNTLALNEGIPRDEFAEFIDHMIHLV